MNNTISAHLLISLFSTVPILIIAFVVLTWSALYKCFFYSLSLLKFICFVATRTYSIFFSTARKSGNISSHTEKLFFVRHSSEYETSDSDRKVIQNLYSQMRGYTWLDESKWPQEWPISPITIIYLKIPSEKMKSFCLHKTGF